MHEQLKHIRITLNDELLRRITETVLKFEAELTFYNNEVKNYVMELRETRKKGYTEYITDLPKI